MFGRSVEALAATDGHVGNTIMGQENKKYLLSKVIYWMISVIIIIFLFFIMFGVLPMLIDHTKLNPVSVIGFIIGVIGAIIIIISLYRPLLFLKHFLAKNPLENSEPNKTAISIVYGLIGMALLSGGLIYSFSSNSTYLVLSFAIPAVLISICTKKMSTDFRVTKTILFPFSPLFQ
jgi:hypothetical protein